MQDAKKDDKLQSKYNAIHPILLAEKLPQKATTFSQPGTSDIPR